MYIECQRNQRLRRDQVNVNDYVDTWPYTSICDFWPCIYSIRVYMIILWSYTRICDYIRTIYEHMWLYSYHIEYDYMWLYSMMTMFEYMWLYYDHIRDTSVQYVIIFWPDTSICKYILIIWVQYHVYVIIFWPHLSINCIVSYSGHIRVHI